MKKLLIIRHAKSSWAIPGQDDFDRPLNDRGHRDAPAMAERIHKKNVEIDAFVSSPANRAFTTAQYFAKEYRTKKDAIAQHRELYHAMPGTFFEVIGKLDDRDKTVAVFSHNPGITAFANLLTEARIDDMPTCAIFAVKADIKHWKDFKDAKKEFWFFDYPKSEGAEQ
ncbi:SixA phosphatase family protein [Sediminibacterium soli]|uniref:SixA phosphatase family protein n=1 Tax=Sediminibacterium soli TaxID=2698829 RepID=UPI00137B7452|nr:histidine phosphatase family protein [Sediminibacterium soli]NCI45086.1 histidine phosphatase family protein [Sediminibacterium soli]